ncbi:ATP-binding cassette transporter [Pseudohyphozyma bogoriensis]|nr:ATP-binding cassette transporter [Pseudohyphozyma bogoriensis]
MAGIYPSELHQLPLLSSPFLTISTLLLRPALTSDTDDGGNSFRVLSYLPALWAATYLLWTSITYFALRLASSGGQPRDRKTGGVVGWLRSWKELLELYIKEEDILALLPQKEVEQAGIVVRRRPTLLLPTLTLFEALWWVGYTMAVVLQAKADCGCSTVELAKLIWSEESLRVDVLLTAAWIFAFGKASSLKSRQPPSSLLLLLVLLFSNTLVDLIRSFHEYCATGPHEHLAEMLDAFRRAPDLVCSGFLIVIILNMPLRESSGIVMPEHEGRFGAIPRPASPEDENTLLGSMTYAWMGSIMRLARTRPLLPSDVWSLSLNNRAEVAVCLNYLRPYLIRRVLESLTAAETEIIVFGVAWTSREQAYVYAGLAGVAVIARGLVELQHYHLARRCGMRLRSEITVAVFEKALSRKDMAGRVQGQLGGAEEQKSNASVGKVISLISEDTNRVLRMIARGRSAARDDRQGTTSELLSAVQTVKFFGWSDSWIAKVQAKRATELKWIVKEWKNRFVMTVLWTGIGILVPLISFTLYTRVAQQELTVAIAFTALSLFGMIQGPLYQIPDFGIKILETLVSIKRIESFFDEDDISPHATPKRRQQAGSTLAFQGATLKWDGPGSVSWRLDNINIEFPVGLTVVTGPTGSGKTSRMGACLSTSSMKLTFFDLVLLALLGELQVETGRISLPPSVSYASQHPFLESTSIKGNILFGFPFSKERYEAVLDACALRKDFEALPEGDNTHHVLLDDCLAAVDSHTANHLYRHVLKGDLLRGRTTVLVTHHVELVTPAATLVVIMDEGRVVSQGAPKNLTDELLDEIETEVDEAANGEILLEPDFKKANIPLPTASKETWSTGEVHISMYWTYLQAGSYLIWGFTILLILGRPAFTFLEQYWLRLWGEAANRGEPVNVSKYLGVYAAIGALSAIRIYIATVAGYTASYRASKSIFTSLLVRVIHAPPRWFDVTPQGRIVNRFSNDMSTVDEALAGNFTSFASQLFSMVAGVLVTSVILPAAFVPTIVCGGYASATLDIWLSIRSQILAAVCLLVSSFVATYSRVSPGLAGIAITSSMTIIQSLDWLCNSYGSLVLGLNSLERITEFLELPQEPAGGAIPPANWPSAVTKSNIVEVQDLVIKYAPELPMVLQGVTFSIKAGERVAIAGRTGSGKSTLAMSLLLRDSRIIIFDESTAAIDFELDRKIQETIRSEFQDACLITIAHRLRTIIDFDRVMVLDQGRIVEFDKPSTLLRRDDSVFHGLCRESGDYEELKEMALTPRRDA